VLQDRDFRQFAEIREEAERYGMPIIVWAYPRGKPVEDAGDRVYLLLQVVDPWLLTLTRQLKFFDRIRGSREEEVYETLVSAVDAALAAVGGDSICWYTSQQYHQAASKAGPVEPNGTP